MKILDAVLPMLQNVEATQRREKMPIEPVITQEGRYYDRAQRRRILLGTVAFVAMIGASIALPMCVAWAESGDNLSRGYDTAFGGRGVSSGGGGWPTDPFGDPVSQGSPRDQQPFGARSGASTHGPGNGSTADPHTGAHQSL